MTLKSRIEKIYWQVKQMVGFDIEHTQLFSTKKRVPYKIVLEFVDYQEFRKTQFSFKDDKDYKITDEEILLLKNFNVDKEWEVEDQQQSVNEENKKLEDYYDFISQKFKEEEEDSSKKLTKDNLSHFRMSILKHQQSYSIEDQVKKYKQFQKSDIKRKKSFELKRIATMEGNGQKKSYLKTKSQIFKSSEDLKFKRHRANFLEEQFDKKKIQNADLLVKINQEISQIEKDIDKENPSKMMTLMDDDEEKEKFFGQQIQDLQVNIKNNSVFKDFKSFSIKTIILKGGDDLRQEMVAMQIIKLFQKIFEKEQTGLYLRPYEIQAINKDSGFLEFLDNTTTIDYLKKQLDPSLLQIYLELFPENEFDIARKNFIDSLAAYSLLIYFVQIKDRHNGNILISQEGYLLHIDFGFLFTTSPGKINFESSPFKLTQDYIDLMDGTESCYYAYFKNQLLKGLQALKKNLDDIITLLEMISHRSLLPCFRTFLMSEFVERFQPFKNEEDARIYIDYLVDESLLNKRTYWYDEFQKLTNGIEP